MIFKNQLNIKYWIVLDIFIVSSLIIELVLGLISISEDIIDHRYDMKVKEETYERPILSIKAKGEQECELDTQLLVFDIWPGLIEGCECLHKNRIYSSKCTNGLLQEGCVKKQKIPPKPITKWRNKEFCVKYGIIDVTDYSYDKSIRKCGIIYQDNTLCYWKPNQNTKKCAINDIVINDEPHHYTNQGGLYESIQLTSPSESSPLYLHWTNKATHNYLISSFKIEDGKICSDPFLKDLNSPYIFDPYYFNRICNNNFNRDIPIYSTKYELIDYIEKSELFSDNGITTPSHNYNDQNNTFLYIKKMNETRINQDKLIISYKYKNDGVDERLAWEFHIVFISLTLLMQLLMIGYKVFYRYHITTCFNWFEMVIMISHVCIMIEAVITYMFSQFLNYYWRMDWITNEWSQNERYKYSIVNIVLSILCVFTYPSDVLVNWFFGFRKEMLEEEEKMLLEKKKND